MLAKEITGKDGAPMALIPEGDFLMGSPDGEGDKDEHPQHTIFLGAYYIDKFEVTAARYAEFLALANRPKPLHWEQVDISSHGNLPVVGVDWHDADAFCRWAGKRLPTEAEWEKAARGTDGLIYPWGNEKPTARLANFEKQGTQNVYRERLAPVDNHEAGKSPHGLHQMAGNVWEWVADWYDETSYEQHRSRNATGPSSGTKKVLRGGSWANEPLDVRSANRGWFTPTNRLDYLGFRCAKDAPQ
jgi:formylglycine-generating enzyme required for sulfatase activity